MVSAILQELKHTLPELFESTTEEALMEAIKASVALYLEKRELTDSNWSTALFNRLIKKHVKLPSKQRDRLPYVAPPEKKCTKCLEVKPIYQFNTLKKKHLPHCKKCAYELYLRPANLRRLEKAGKKPRSEMSKMSAEEKVLKNRAHASAWKKKNRDKVNAAKRAKNALRNPPKPKVVKPPKQPKVKLSPEQVKANRKVQKRRYRLNNPEKAAAERARYVSKAKQNSHYRIARNIRKRLKEFLGSGTKIGSFSGMVGCTKEFLLQHLEAQFEAGMNWDNYGEWHIDHVKPMAAFDLTDKASRSQVNHYSNLRPMWKAENEEKSSFWNGVRYAKGKPVVTDTE